MFRLQDGSVSTALVTEQFSGLANLLPDLDGTTITSPGLLSADGAYGALLAQAQPLTATTCRRSAPSRTRPTAPSPRRPSSR